MTAEEFAAQLDAGEIGALEEIGDGVEPEHLDFMGLEMVARFIHYGLVTTREQECWVCLVLTDAGRAVLARSS